jgi:hypothetical protein
MKPTKLNISKLEMRISDRREVNSPSRNRYSRLDMGRTQQRGRRMTKQTIKLVDTYCTAANWQSSINSNRDTLDRVKEEVRQRNIRGGNPHDTVSHPYIDEIVGEIAVWSKRRDKFVAKLRVINAGLTDDEKQWVRQKCGGEKLAQDFRELGVEPSWGS